MASLLNIQARAGELEGLAKALQEIESWDRVDKAIASGELRVPTSTEKAHL